MNFVEQAYLVLRSGPRRGEAVPLRDGLTIGREGCDLVLEEDEKVSRKHASIEQRDGRFWIVDGPSTHGTFVNRERVSACALTSGDQVQLGRTVFSVTDGVASEVVREIPTAARPMEAPTDSRLRLFYQLAGAVEVMSDTRALLGRLLPEIVAVLGAERGLFGICEPGGLETLVFARSGAPSDVVLAREVRDAVLLRQSTVLLREPPTSATLARQQVQSAMAAPISAGGKPIGILYADDRGRSGRFGEADLELLSALGRLCAAVITSAERFQSAAAQAEVARSVSPFAALLGKSDPMEKLRAHLEKVAQSDANVVIHGETGTGKELVARALHALSERATQPLVALSCAALHESTVESELFGHVPGAFTGADKTRRGAFVLAHRGVLFLDEIGDIPLATQAKLLRVLQEREVHPLGAERPTRVDVRVVAASHKDLFREVQAGRFREDLFYRLHVVDVAVPPLRARGDDVLLLARHFLAGAARRLGKALIGFSGEAEEALVGHDWPGNVRELHNEAERAAIVATGPLVEVWDLSARLRGAPVSIRPRGPETPTAPSELAPTLAERFAALEPTERALVREALEAAKGNLAEGARLLGVTWIMLKRRAERFGLIER